MVFKNKKNGVFYFELSFFRFRDNDVSYYANEESDDVICVIGRTTLLAPANQRSTFLISVLINIAAKPLS